MSKLLIIPHQPMETIKIRSVEIARHLASLGRHQVYLLQWDIYPRLYRSHVEKIFFKTLEVLKTAATPYRITEKNSLRSVSMPYLLAPVPWCQLFNQRQVEHLIRDEGIDTVISANAYHFPMPEEAIARRIYDVIDDHISPDTGPQWQRTRAFTLNELGKADAILAVSRSMQEKLKDEGFPDTLYIPNGVDVKTLRQVSSHAVQSVSDRYDLGGRFVIGYVGNHGPWSGLNMLLDAFRQAHPSLPPCKLMIVGPLSPELLPVREKAAAHPDIVFTGAVAPSNIAAYLQRFDLGVLASPPSPFRDHATPLKILEYGAARKPVLATPLKELRLLDFPYVTLAEADPDAWTAALMDAANRRFEWQPGWDRLVEAYDWPNVLKPLADLLEESHAHPV